MTDNQIKIRIQIPQSSNQTEPEQDNTDPKQAAKTVQNEAENFHFDWRKISLALLLVAGLLCWMGFTIYQWISDVPTGAQTTTTDNTVVTTNINQSSPTSDKSESSLTEMYVENKNNSLTPPSKTLTTSLPTEKLILKKPIIAKPNKAIAPKPLAKPNNIGPSSAVISTNTTQVGLPPEVTRIQLTRAIEQREPIDTIDHVWLNKGVSERIYLFLQLRNLSGQQVSVHWHYEGQEIAIVKLNIGNQNWRTNASKLLSVKRLGAWRVALHDQSGNLLAQQNFTVSINP